MAEPLPPDPYLALGVPKDATSAAIKSAYRKAVLKCHPDKAKGREDEFHRIQAAFEIVGDDDKRQKYDDTVYLESLRRENQQRRGSRPNVDIRTAAFDFRAGSAAFFARGPTRVYEERRPKPQYNDDFRYYDTTEENRTSSRKYDGYEASPKKPSPRPSKPADDLKRDPKVGSVNSKDRAYQKKQRERDTVRERERKYNAYAEDADHSDEGFFDREPTTRTYEREPPRRRDDGFNKHSAQAAQARDYMTQTRGESFSGDTAPPPTPSFSRSASYKEPEIGVRKVGKDQRPAMFKRSSTRSTKEKTPEPVRKPSSGKDRRSSKDPETVNTPMMDDRRPPPLQTHFYSSNGSLPRETRRSKTGDVETELREPRRGLHRAETMPNPRPSTARYDSAPTTPSNLRFAETNDSGYSTSNSTSSTPPPQFSSKKYHYNDGANDDPVTVEPEQSYSTYFREPTWDKPRTKRPSQEEMAYTQSTSARRPVPEPTRSNSFQPEPQPMKTSRRTPSGRANNTPRKPADLPRGNSMPLPKSGRGPNDPLENMLFGEVRSTSPTDMFDSQAYNRDRDYQRQSEEPRSPGYDTREFRRASSGGDAFGADRRRELPRRSSEQYYSMKEADAKSYINRVQQESPLRPSQRRQAAY